MWMNAPKVFVVKTWNVSIPPEVTFVRVAKDIRKNFIGVAVCLDFSVI